MTSIFISYRRRDSGGYAGRIYDRLVSAFSEDSVFMDIDSIQPGADFIDSITQTLDRCSIVLVLIGPEWNPTSGDNAFKRLDDPTDWIRVEVSTALSRPGIRVVPILIGNTPMPAMHDLPADLAELTRRNALEISDRRFHQDMNDLIEMIKRNHRLAQTHVMPTVHSLEPPSPTHVEQRDDLFSSLSDKARDPRLVPTASDRVSITFEVGPNHQSTELPLVIGVLADLSGSNKDRWFEDREFLDIDATTFNARLDELRPRLELTVPNTLTGEGNLRVNLEFASLESFSPDQVARNVDVLRTHLLARDALRSLFSITQASATGSRELETLCFNLDMIKTAAKEQSYEDCERSDFWKKVQLAFRPKTQEAFECLIEGVRALAQWAMRDIRLVEADIQKTIVNFVRKIDGILSEQTNGILHNEAFQRLESTWLGLHRLVTRVRSNETLKIRILDLSKRELLRALKHDECETYKHSFLFREIYQREFGQLGGEPYSCLIGDYYFDHSPEDVSLLRELASIAAAAHAPFITGVAPTLLNLHSWSGVSRRNISKQYLVGAEYVDWNALRNSESAMYLCLCMPGFLARVPYEQAGEQFSFNEDLGGMSESRFTWVNAAFAVAENVGRSFRLYGWGAHIDGVGAGGLISELPVYHYQPEVGGPKTMASVEAVISNESDFAKLGLTVLVYHRNSDMAAVLRCRTLYDYRQHGYAQEHYAYLSTMLCCCRFFHYVKCMALNKCDSFADEAALMSYLDNWFKTYVEGDSGAISDDKIGAVKPLAVGRVRFLGDDEEERGERDAIITLLPRHQFEGSPQRSPKPLKLSTKLDVGRI